MHWDRLGQRRIQQSHSAEADQRGDLISHRYEHRARLGHPPPSARKGASRWPSLLLLRLRARDSAMATECNSQVRTMLAADEQALSGPGSCLWWPLR